MSDSVRPHRRQPTRLPRPWDSPGKNTEVGCHFLLQCMKVKSESEVAQLCPTLSDPMDCSLPGSSAHGIFQARVLEWDAFATTCFKYDVFRAKRNVPLCSRIRSKTDLLILNSDYLNLYLYNYLKISNKVYRRRQWHPTPVLLPGKSHGRRSLVGCSPWGL